MSGLPLRTKLILSFALAALVPLTAILLVSSYLVSSKFEAETAERVARTGRRLEETLARDGQDIADKIKALSADFDFKTALYSFANAATRRRAQVDLYNMLIQTRLDRDLDLLQLTSPDGIIVASGHERARFGKPDQGALALAKRYHGTPVLAREEGIRVKGPALKVSVEVGEDPARLWLTGGMLVNESFLDRLQVDAPDALLVVMRDGAPLATPSELGRQALAVFEASNRPSTRRELERRLAQANRLVKEVTLEGVTRAEPVRVYLVTSRQPLDELLGELNLTFVALAVVGVMLACVMGLVLARPVSSQVDRLVEALEKVAAGDLTARVEVRRDDELGQVAQAFNEMTRDLAENKTRLLAAERVAAWQGIARRLAHEIKNPLSPIQLSIETLRKCYRQQREDFGSILEESTATVLEEVERLRRIVQEFSDFARLPKPQMVHEDLNEVVRSVMALYAGLDARHRVRAELEQEMCRCVFDPDQMSRALHNLIKNSLEAMPAGGEIMVATRRREEGVELSVADDGPGLDAEARSHLFQPYWTSKSDGTGLGLAIVHRIVSEHGGQIALDESVARGVRFILTLPVKHNASPTAGTAG